MQSPFHVIPGAITAPQGFVAAGVFCDLKRLGTGKGSQKGAKRDLGLLVSQVPATVAGLFTTNQVCAAPVQVSRVRASRARARAIVANSGNANACTGRAGLRDAQQMTAWVAQQLRLRADQVLVCSTGRIGVRLPMPKVRTGILDAVRQLDNSPAAAHHFAEAILTTDTGPKEVAVELALGGQRVRLAGVCKGAGMIQPGMSATAARPWHATMLCFLTTDAAVESRALKAALSAAVAQSFNCITVDGDMSTNDSVILLANGLAGHRPLTLAAKDRPELARFQAALNYVTLELAKRIVRNGEGASRFVTIRVEGARSDPEADAAARAVGNSQLVKTSWCGGDPNWGRILDALGYSSARIVEAKVDVGYSLPDSRRIRWALKRGQPARTALRTLHQLTARKEFDLHVRLHLGRGRAVIYAADLTEAYVDFNKGE